jgi:AraC-like DNA-binding protein
MLSEDGRWGLRSESVTQWTPPPALRSHVASITVIDRGSDSIDRVFTLPDGRATLLFCIVAGARADCAGRFADAEGNLHILGAATRAYAKLVRSTPQTIVVRFKMPGAFHFLNLSMRSIADEDVSLEELHRRQGRTLKDALLRADSTLQRLQILQNFLLGQLENSSHRSQKAWHLVSDALPGVARSNPPAQCRSTRQLRRLFNDVIGVSPHTLQRIERFNWAVRVLRSTPTLQQGEIAAKCGYYDQAHMIGEFREFVAITPSALLAALDAGLPHLHGSWFEPHRFAAAAPLSALTTHSTTIASP